MESKTCPNCKVQNRREARFCKNCGLWLLANCLYCDAVLPEGALFCDRCGRALNAQAMGVPAPVINERSEARPAKLVASERPSEAARTGANAEAALVASHLQEFIPEELLTKLQAARDKGGMVGERRIVTMLFCDVKGSTAAAEHLDPEDWSEIMNGAFTHMIKPVYRYEGTVARLMGDALLAFFGAPIAHADHAARAVRASIEKRLALDRLRAKWDREGKPSRLEMGIGLNTAEVFVGLVGSGRRVNYTVMGDGVNLASRLQDLTKDLRWPLLIGESTYEKVKDNFEIEFGDTRLVKGKTIPVKIYKVLAEHGAPTERRVRPLFT